MGSARRCQRSRQHDHALLIHGQALGRATLLPQTRKFQKRVWRFSNQGVEFPACGNTMKSQNVGLKDLLPGFIAAERGGVVRIAEMQSQGYLYLRP